MANQWNLERQKTPEEISQRRKFIVECRVKHMSFEDIAERIKERFGYSISTVMVAEDFRIVMRQRNKELHEDVDALRAMSLAQLNRAAESILPKVELGDLDALETYLKIQNRIAKLTGIDAPVQREDVTPRQRMTAIELVARMDEIRNRVAGAVERSKGLASSGAAPEIITVEPVSSENSEANDE